jgi:hypothetical protein
MKTMEELILDRLIEEATRPLRAELEKAKSEISVETARGNALAQTYRDAMASLERETELRRKLQNDARIADGPITELYKAADAYLRARSGRLTKEQNLKGRLLNQALTAAEHYVDLIPF